MRTKNTFLYVLAFIACILTSKAQTTWTVDNTPGSGAQFSDIQSAINAASNGDTILVQQSNTSYFGSSANNNEIVINKSINLIGRSTLENGYLTQTGTIRFTNGSSGTTIKGINVSSGSGIINLIDTSIPNPSLSNILIEDCVARVNLGSNNSGGAYTITNVTLRGSTISEINFGTYASNIFINNCALTRLSVTNTNTLVFRNNVFRIPSTSQPVIVNSDPNATINLTNTIFFGGSSILRISGNYQLNNCLLYNVNNPSTPITVEPNSSAINNVQNCIFAQDPQFIQSGPLAVSPGLTSYSNFNVLAGSPAIGAGINGGNIGYQASYTFKQLGQPKGYPAIKITNYQSIVQPNGTLTFDIEATAH